MTAPFDFHLIPSRIGSKQRLCDEEVYLVLPDHEEGQERYDLNSVQAFQRAANYLAVAQIYLQDNVLLDKPLDYDAHVKKRLLGHFGTVPGLVFAYTHATALLARIEKNVANGNEAQQSRGIFVTGPGHGAPAILGCLYLEGSISKFYPDESLSVRGFRTFIKNFSWPNTVRPSHVTATTPGAIHEGGELGYALSVAHGAVMDKPDLIAFAMIGDGEAETGPTAAAWHSHKFISPAESGAVLPILHLNRFKISEKTIYGAMDRIELVSLFTGFGYQVRFVDYYQHLGHRHTVPGDRAAAAFDVDMAVSLDWAYGEIRDIQKAARGGAPIKKPRWPMIILSSPKGWGGPTIVDGQQIEGTFRSHQVPIKVDPSCGRNEHLELLEKWMGSYDPHTCFEIKSGELQLSEVVTRMLPSNKLRMGQVREIYEKSQPLEDVSTSPYMVASETSGKGEKAQASAMQQCGQYLAALIPKNSDRFLIFSPDELVSNKLDATLSVEGFKARKFEHDSESFVSAEERNNGTRSGRVIELLSEHTLQGFAQGYALTGRISLFPSYESFLGIVTTMIAQFAKFLKVARSTDFRPPVPSITYVMSSTLWRQEHNGASHQQPGLINSVLDLPHNVARVYLPPDANCALSTLSHCLRSRNYVNLIVGSKHQNRVYLSEDEANAHCKAGGSIWHAYSTDGGNDPDIVIVGIGTETTAEAIAATELLRYKHKEGVNGSSEEKLRVRFINITDLMILSEGSVHPHALNDEAFDGLFTRDVPILFNFHGYTTAVKGLLGDRLSGEMGRRPMAILGFIEEGSTTTAWNMLKLNGVDRFTVACKAMELVKKDLDLKKQRGAKMNERVQKLVEGQKLDNLARELQEKREEWQRFIDENGRDPPEIEAS
ncbi:probable xylulose-5-phosphate/fructose-6-phosphate phosphoketolase [Melanopsichium pennsylvanicum]|uniref:Probable xylulose-5-phosphate/fructose-6-phosphate phosphoketolase n=2 Tax=Melanopsichium pennsylvanicum TaxID=63383 RepID=A0AAJ4XP24_9BASI|nr:probable xylulose-5-phosphate/fructose-6-phosphate phosphoketolase [Melanopsichium pennsylvanicum 4]SNX85894.1 probable xylulose-5-phosphate/fructose-6-phosphate phosphoketolase [Melanopsichium pennsylvanicum]